MRLRKARSVEWSPRAAAKRSAVTAMSNSAASTTKRRMTMKTASRMTASKTSRTIRRRKAGPRCAIFTRGR
jgi:hypothetical protein